MRIMSDFRTLLWKWAVGEAAKGAALVFAATTNGAPRENAGNLRASWTRGLRQCYSPAVAFWHKTGPWCPRLGKESWLCA